MSPRPHIKRQNKATRFRDDRTSDQEIMTAKKRPEHCSRQRWRIELRRRARERLYPGLYLYQPDDFYERIK